MDGFLKVAGAAQVCQDDKLDEARRKQDAAQAAFSTLLRPNNREIFIGRR